jgi:uncharacterized protein
VVVEWTWDPDKDRRNRAKHQGLGLAAGVVVLADPLSLSLPDPHPDCDRWRTVGSAAGAAVLLVVHTTPAARPDGREVGRIISVRKATLRERRAYEESIV